VMKSVRDGVRNNSARSVETMPMVLRTHAGIRRRIREAWPQGGVWPTAVVMREPGPPSFLQMLLVQGDNPIQTLTPKCPNQPFAQRVCLGASHGFKAKMPQRSIEPAEKIASRSWMMKR
jgi:hypothetical protein